MLQANQKRFARAAAKLEGYGVQVLEKEQVQQSIASFITWKPDLLQRLAQVDEVVQTLKWAQCLYSDCRFRSAGLGMSIAFLNHLLAGGSQTERVVWSTYFDRWPVVLSIQERLRSDLRLVTILDVTQKIQELCATAHWLADALHGTDPSLDHAVYLKVADGVVEDLLIHLRYRESNYFAWMSFAGTVADNPSPSTAATAESTRRIGLEPCPGFIAGARADAESDALDQP